MLRKIIISIRRPMIMIVSPLISKFGELTTDKLAANVIGPFSLIFISMLVFTIILGIYCCLIKVVLHDWPLWRFAMHWVAGHIVAVNILYHYYYCAFTDPGLPNVDLSETFAQSGWCRKCSAVKPPLTHHCSVCRRCVLRMDHHCTWMNNCVGWKNHRHFFLFCFFMCAACLYAFYFGSELFYSHSLYGFGFTASEKSSSAAGGVVASFGNYKFDCQSTSLVQFPATSRVNVGKIVIRQTLHPFRSGVRLHRFIVVTLYLCSLFFVLLAFLVVWHAWLISIGHTSIDNMGGVSKSIRSMPLQEIIANWRLFLGLDQPNGTLFNRFLIPSQQVPTPLQFWIARMQKENAHGLIGQKSSAQV